MHLERILHSQGFGTRKECRSLIRHGLVKVAGQVYEDPFIDFPVIPGWEFQVDDDPWVYYPLAYIILNKPTGYECSRKPLHHPSILSLLPNQLRNRDVQPIGRLDEDTTGLLLMTDDGKFNHFVSSPKRKLEKVYIAECKHPLDDKQINNLLKGVRLLDEPEPIAALAAEALGPHTLQLTIGEGKYHQVKRMVAAARNRVESLRRVSIGQLNLPEDLPLGCWRWMSEAELNSLNFPR